MSDDPMESLRLDFLLDSRERLERLEATLLDWGSLARGERSEQLDALRRDAHTLKGNAGMMGFGAIQNAAHALEDRLGGDPGALDPEAALEALDVLAGRVAGLDPSARTAPEASAGTGRLQDGVRVPFAELDRLVDALSEMVVLQNQLADGFGRARRRGSEEDWERADESRVLLDKTLRTIRERILRLRMVPLRRLFGSLHRVAHDQAAALGKQLRFDVLGGETPIDKGLLEVASEALGHLVRNAVVHGIEAPEERAQRGKPRQGRVQLRALSDANGVQIDVVDDGGGIDREALVASARSRGIETHPEDDLASLVFLSGVSARSGADLSAGRGVGLPAALAAARRMGGTLTVQSQPGEGTRLRMRLPLSVSLVRALLFAADGEEYALPLSAVVQSTWFRAREARRLESGLVLPWRDGVLPLLDIGETFATAPGVRSRGTLLVLDDDGRQRGIVADAVTGIRDIVVKQAGPLLGDAPGILGSTILGDGRVVLILDPPGLFAWSRRPGSAA